MEGSRVLPSFLKTLLAKAFWNRGHAHGGIDTWMQEPVVREAINESVTGSAGVWPIEALRSHLDGKVFTRAASLGCGTGALERDLFSKGICRTIDGFDLSPQALAIARQLAVEAGYSEIRYEEANLNEIALPESTYDAVFFHQSLHHVEDLDHCLSQVARTLTPGGFVYFDEYVGPSRDEWSRELIADAEAFYAELPGPVRRSRRLSLPVDWRDPSEAVRSSRIVDAISRHLVIQEKRDYGGNLLAVIYPHLQWDDASPEMRRGVLSELIAAERRLLRAGASSFYAVIRATAG
jgi:SAM-dependent methyltransferase